MPLARSTLVFFDASAVFLAANSPLGGSAFLLSTCARGYLRAAVSPDVLLEAERNLADKGRPGSLPRYHALLADTPFLVASAPPEPLVRQFAPTFVEDAHVIAAALSSHASYLITLDRRFERRVRASGLPIEALSPRDFQMTHVSDSLQRTRSVSRAAARHVRTEEDSQQDGVCA